MTEKVRVRNTAPYDIGVMGLNGIGYNIKSGLFILMNREDVEYNMALAPKLFEKPAMLVVEDEELSMNMGIDDVKTATYTDADLEKAIKSSASKFREFLQENSENKHILERVAKIVKKMDLPASKIRALQEVLPHRDFVN